MPEVLAVLSVLIAFVLLGSGCDWYAVQEVSLRPLPYPYQAGAAVDGGHHPECLSSRGVALLFDGEKVRTTGQNAVCSLVDRGRQLWESIVFLYSRREWHGSSFFGNRLIEARHGSDGDVVHAYKIYVGLLARLPVDMPPEAVAQVAEAVAYELKAKGGVMLLDGPESGGERQFDAVDDFLKGERRQGGIYYVELEALLSYSFVRGFLDWEATDTDDGVVIEIRSVDDGFGTRWVPTAEELAGITFYTPDPGNTRILVAGRALESVDVNPPDHTRRSSVTIRHAPAGETTQTVPSAVSQIAPADSPADNPSPAELRIS